ncbi:hypothetical protein D3C76_1180720 [compost metagenome]
MAKASTTTTTRNNAETIFMGFSIRAAKRGATRRMNMPMATGTSTMANTCRTLANCSAIACSLSMKCASDRLTTNGMVRMAITEFTAVSVTFRATSPWARWL